MTEWTAAMSTTILGPMPPEVQELIRRRKKLGQDIYDEVWEGNYHMVPGPHPRHSIVQGELFALLREPLQRTGLLLLAGPFNVGDKDDFRVPDGGVVRPPADETFLSTAVVVFEVLSPEDETYEKFDFYHRHRVGWLLIADPNTQRVWLYARGERGYETCEEIPGIVNRVELESRIKWP